MNKALLLIVLSILLLPTLFIPHLAFKGIMVSGLLSLTSIIIAIIQIVKRTGGLVYNIISIVAGTIIIVYYAFLIAISNISIIAGGK